MKRYAALWWSLAGGAAVASDWSGVVAASSPGIVAVHASTRPWDHALSTWLTTFGGVAPRASTPSAPSRAAGVVLAPQRVATVLHAVTGAEEVSVRDATGASHDATVLQIYPDRDLAWLAVPTLTAPPLSRATGVVGEAVLSAGFPTHDGLVVAEGILSGAAQRRVGTTEVRRWWLTDALIRPGQSGGPLLDAQGAVVGLAVGGHDRGSGAEGLGLALPSEDVPSPPPDMPAPVAAIGPADARWTETAEGLRAEAVGPVAQALGLQQGDVVATLHGAPAHLDAVGDGARVAVLTSGRVVVLAGVR